MRGSHQVHDDPSVGQRKDLERAVRSERNDQEVAIDIASVTVVEHGGLGPLTLATPCRQETRAGSVGHGDLNGSGSRAHRKPGLHGDRRAGRRSARGARVHNPARCARRIGSGIPHDVHDDASRL